MERLKLENAEFYRTLANASAMLASMQYSISNLLAIHSGFDIVLPEELMVRLSSMNMDLNRIKIGMIQLEDEYKRRAWKRK